MNYEPGYAYSSIMWFCGKLSAAFSNSSGKTQNRKWWHLKVILLSDKSKLQGNTQYLRQVKMKLYYLWVNKSIFEKKIFKLSEYIQMNHGYLDTCEREIVLLLWSIQGFFCVYLELRMNLNKSVHCLYLKTRAHTHNFTCDNRNVLSYSLEPSQIVSYVEENGFLFKDYRQNTLEAQIIKPSLHSSH